MTNATFDGLISIMTTIILTIWSFKGDPSEAIQINKTSKIYNLKPLKYTKVQNHGDTNYQNPRNIQQVI